MARKKVLVTGISGFVGQHCAVELLKSGYSVRGSLRSLSKENEVRAGIGKAIDPKNNLEFCQLNLLADGGWDDAMRGCDYVLHVASPFVSKEPKHEDELIKPAVEGTLRALRAASKAGIKRIVITSSVVAMVGDQKVARINQDSWSDAASGKISAYMKSKTLAERAAWDFINKQTSQPKLELCTVNPGPIFGPTLTNNLSGTSMSMIAGMISGKVPMLPNCKYAMSDVRDVAKVHVLALEHKKANGKRFIAADSKSYSFQKFAETMKANGYDKVSSKLAPSWLLKFMSLFSRDARGMLPFVDANISADNSLTRNTLGWSPIPFEKMVLDTAASVKQALKV